MNKFFLLVLTLLASSQLVQAQDIRLTSTEGKSKEEIYMETRQQLYESSTIVMNGQQAPDLEALRLDGSKIRLSDYKGKVVHLSFWATWCGPCLQELRQENLPSVLKPFLNHPDYVLIPIAQDHKDALVKFFSTKKGKEYSWLESITLIDGDRENFHVYASKFIPRNVIIGRDGRVVETCIGGDHQEAEMIQRTLSELLKETK